MRVLFILLAHLFAGFVLKAQDEPLQPFVCDGSFYQAIAPFLESTLHEVTVDPYNGSIRFEELPGGGLGAPINPIGYRSSDNFIYGISPTNLHLYRIGADGRGQMLDLISDLDNGLDYPAGAISPDGRYFILIGVSQGRDLNRASSEILLYIDLESPNFSTRQVTLQPNNVQSFDIAFDPMDGSLYGFDATRKRLFTIDPESGSITLLPVINVVAESLGSLFFDPFGNLFGYGNRDRSQKQNTFFRINKADGRAFVLAKGPEAQLTDGCSCPYTVAMKADIQPIEAYACTQFKISLDIVNSSGQERAGLSLTNSLPVGFTIVGLENPLGGTISSGLGTNVLLLEEFILPLGISTLILTLEAGSDLEGQFDSQAFLEGLPPSLGATIASDNATTLIREDPIKISVLPLMSNQINREFRLCPGDSLTLDAGLLGVKYLWDNGDTLKTRLVDQPGTYSVKISSKCDTLTSTYSVVPEDLQLDMPPDATLSLGDSLQLMPFLIPATGLDLTWSSSENDLSCYTCKDPFAKPLFDASYDLLVHDPRTGCKLEKSMMINVRKNREVFMPTAFSPNGDGMNDYLFPQSQSTEIVRNFAVYARWGEQIFRRQNFSTNDLTMGWDGTLGGKPMTTGSYIFIVEVEFLDGVSQIFKGECSLMR